jgi:hypothetical protein
MFERIQASADWIRKNGRSETLHASVLIACSAFIPKDKQRLGIDLYAFFKEIDDTIDESGADESEKYVLLQNLTALFTSNAIASSAFPAAIISNRYFSPTIKHRVLWGLHGYERDISRQKSEDLSESAARDVRIREMFPYVAIATELVFNKILVPNNTPNFKKFLRVVELSALSGDIRDVEEDRVFSINKFTKRERDDLGLDRAVPDKNKLLNYQKNLIQESIILSRDIHQLDDLTPWQSRILTTALTTRIALKTLHEKSITKRLGALLTVQQE